MCKKIKDVFLIKLLTRCWSFMPKCQGYTTLKDTRYWKHILDYSISLGKRVAGGIRSVLQSMNRCYLTEIFPSFRQSADIDISGFFLLWNHFANVTSSDWRTFWKAVNWARIFGEKHQCLLKLLSILWFNNNYCMANKD